ncbi:LuxR C-terminal-related transcriptional regulator [Nonomuraea wenchangensis]|uniref:LuxR C-terminal-related transcriptional regulator n=1 Tax=Nonomuraea wenchangensis TaxID=568860 RepID=UPI003320A155
MISATTVRTHITRILAKLGLRDRVHAVVLGYESGLAVPATVPDQIQVGSHTCGRSRPREPPDGLSVVGESPQR